MYNLAAGKRNKYVLVVLMSLLAKLIRTAELDPDYQGETFVSAVSGTRAHLPCDLTSNLPDDNVYLVLWYRQGSGMPIYTLDARRVSDLSLADHRADDPSLGRRAYFLTVGDPPMLSIEDPKPEDAAVYMCRVDFQESPTRYTKVNLTIISPPDSVLIFDKTDQEVSSVIGPYRLGDSLHLVCVAIGGNPPPRVKWFLESAMIDDTYQIKEDALVKNELSISSLRQEHLMASLLCRANNNNQTMPITATVTIDLNLPPMSVTMLNKDEHLSAEKAATFTCTSKGSRPPPAITWWKDSQRVYKDATPLVSPDGETATSTLSIKVTKSDDGQLVKCRAVNSLFPDVQLEDLRKIEVYYAPEVVINLGGSLNPHDIKVGDDVYFECRVKANPPAFQLVWLHNGQRMRHNVKAGIIMSNQSLVVQQLDRDASGTYQCVVDNTEGQASSRKLHLHIQYPPECHWKREPSYAVALEEETRIQCQVLADPDKVKYTWMFNSTSGYTPVPNAKVSESGRISILTYTPTTSFHFGTLLCWGENSVGVQMKPCVFHIVQAGPPEPLLDCSLGNETWNSFQVHCTAGYDGGVAQMFVLELYEDAHLQLNLTSSTNPRFLVQGLHHNARYTAMVYASNRKGKSPKTRLDGETTSRAEKHTGGASVISPVLAALIGVVLGVIVAAFIVAVCLKSSIQGMKRLSTKPPSQSPASPAEENNPDVVPFNNSTDTEFPDKELLGADTEFPDKQLLGADTEFPDKQLLGADTEFPDKRFARLYPETASFPEINPYHQMNNLRSVSPTYSETDL